MSNAITAIKWWILGLLLMACAFGQKAKLVPRSDLPTQFAVQLSWTQSDSPNVISNCVYRSATSGGPYGQLGCFNATESYLDTAPLFGPDFYVATAVDDAGVESPFSNEATAFVPSVTPPTRNKAELKRVPQI